MVTCMQGLTTLVSISFSTAVSRLSYEVTVGAFPTLARQKVWTAAFKQAMDLLIQRLSETGATKITFEVIEDGRLFVRPGMTVVDIKPGELLGDFEQTYAAIRMLS